MGRHSLHLSLGPETVVVPLGSMEGAGLRSRKPRGKTLAYSASPMFSATCTKTASALAISTISPFSTPSPFSAVWVQFRAETDTKAAVRPDQLANGVTPHSSRSPRGVDQGFKSAASSRSSFALAAK